MNSKQPLKIKIAKLNAEYSSTFHFKIKLGLKTSKDHIETVNAYKYEKGSSSVNIEESLDCPFDITPTSDSLLQFCLQIYTKNGYKTAGAGELLYSKIKNNAKNDIEFLKCPLGKGSIEVWFTFGKSNVTDTNCDQDIIDNKVKSNANEDTDKYKQEIEALNNKLNDSQTENESLTSQITKLKKELIALKSTISSQSNANNNTVSTYKIEEQLKDKERVIEELKTQNVYFNEENTELKGIVNDLKAEKKKVFDEKNEMIKKLKEENDTLNDKLTNIQYQLDQYTQDKQKANDQSLQLTKQNDLLKAQSQDQLKILHEKNQSLTKTIQDKDNEIKDSNDQIASLKKTIEHNETEYKQKIDKEKEIALVDEQELTKKHQAAIGDKDMQIIKLTTDLEEKEETIQSLETKIEQIAQSKIDNNNNDIIILTKTLNEKDSEIRQLKDQMDLITSEKEKFETQIKCYEMDNHSYLEMSKSTEKKLKDDLIKLRAVIDSKRSEIQKLSDENAALRYENDQAKTDIKTVESNQINNADFINRIQDMQKSFVDRENKLMEEKNQEILSLKKDNEVLKLQMKKNTIGIGDNSKYLTEITRLQEHKTSLEEDLKYYKELNMKFVDTEKKSIVLESDNANLRNTINEKNALIETLQKQNKDMIANKDLLEIEIIASKEKLGMVLNELSEVETKQLMISNKENNGHEGKEKSTKKKK